MTARLFRPPRRAFILAAAAFLTAYAGLLALHVRTGTLSEGSAPATIGWAMLAAAAYLVLLVVAERSATSTLRWFWLLAITARLLLLFTTPTLSTDVYRYLWDGHVAVNGVSPYAHAIDAPELDPLDHPVRAQTNNAWMASPYLPAAEALFWFVALWLPLIPLSMQVMMVIFDLLTALLLSRLLARAGLPRRRLLIYLLNPLVIIEIAHGAHVDVWMIWLTVAAVWATLAAKRLPSLAPILLALAVGTKGLPLLAAPLLFWRWSWSQRLVFGLALLALLLPAGWRAGWGLGGAAAGTGLFGALLIYLRQWQFNSGLFHALAAGLQAAGVADAGRWAGAFTTVCLAGVLAVIWWRARAGHPAQAADRSTRTLLRQMGLPFAAYLLLTPTVHPWYALIVLTFLPFWPPGVGESKYRWVAILPWLWLSSTLIFSYLSYSDPAGFRELNWVRVLEWGPTWLLLGLVLGVMYRSYCKLA